MAGASVLAFPPKGAPAPIAGGSDDFEDDGKYLTVEKLRRQYYDYLGSKSAEIEEQKDARRYYHGSQWTAAEIQTLKDRKQPVVTYNRIVRKLDAVVGLVERLKQSPKAYARTPQHQEGADLATAVLRYVLDSSDWKSKEPRVARFAAIDGVAGVEYDLEKGDQGDPELKLHLVYPDTFFYDPRSYDEGFTDCRFVGVSKWVDVDQAKEIVPGHDQEIDDLVESGTDLTSNSDREVAWVNSTSKRVRLVDHWYITGEQWRWCLYINMTKLMEGISPYADEKGKTFAKYRMFSASVDQDGDRYGFIRNLKSPQDELNHRRSKALHLLNSRRVRATKGIVDDVEKARQEEARPDGFIELNPMGADAKYEPDDARAMADMRAHAEMTKEAKDEIENFGPNPALIGQGLEDSSGRAIALLQQAGIAELGPYLTALKSWKERVYRDIWNIVQKHWTAERWIRVTDDDQLAQFFQINKLTVDEYGRPSLVNAIGSLDVDFLLDEGPDTINMQADAYGVLQSLGPQFIQEFPDIAIDLAPLENGVKKKMLDKIKAKQDAPTPPDPKVQAMQATMQLNQQAQEADLSFQARKADSDAQLKRQQAADDIQLEREKAAAQIEIEREKVAGHLQIEGAKADHSMHVSERQHSQKMQMEREQTDQKVTSESETALAKTGEGPAVKALTQAVGKMSEAVDGMKTALTAPRKIIRDGQGRPAGVQVG